MRRIILLILVFAFLSVTGCSNSTAETSSESSPSVTVPSADNSSKATPSPAENKIVNTNNQSSSSDVDLASKAYRRLLAGDFSEVRAKTGVTNTGEDYARQYAPFYSVNPDENKWEYTLVDMDDDGIPELFIRIETSPDITAIFHWTNDGIICWDFDTVEATSFYTPLGNGMIWSKYKNSNNIIDNWMDICLGIIAFSIKNNRITFFGIFREVEYCVVEKR